MSLMYDQNAHWNCQARPLWVTAGRAVLCRSAVMQAEPEVVECVLVRIDELLCG
jgi:hypothetical protein